MAIDAPAAAGAGTLAKLVAKEYNLIYLDTGKIYRFVGMLKLKPLNCGIFICSQHDTCPEYC